MTKMVKVISGLILFIKLLGSGTHETTILVHEVSLLAKEVKELKL